MKCPLTRRVRYTAGFWRRRADARDGGSGTSRGAGDERAGSNVASDGRTTEMVEGGRDPVAPAGVADDRVRASPTRPARTAVKLSMGLFDPTSFRASSIIRPSLCNVKGSR